MEQELGSRNALTSFENAKFNNRLAYLINTLSVLILLLCGAAYAVQHWFTVDKIIIQGDIQHITPVQLSYIAKNKLHGTFFTLDIRGLKTEFQQIPWVRQVTLKRHFPHTIEVNLIEYKVLARIGDDALLAENGEVFEGADDNIALPIFYVDLDKTPLALAKFYQIEALLLKHDDHLQKLWISSPRVTSFQSAKNLRVTICEADLINKLAILDKYWNQLYHLNPGLNSVNLCYSNALAINSVAKLALRPQASATTSIEATLKVNK